MNAPPTSSGRVPAAGIGLATGSTSSLPFAYTLAAFGTAGFSQTVPMAGSSFYLESTDGPVTIQPIGMDSDTYEQGEGLNVAPAIFGGLIVTNPSAVPVTFNLKVGTAEFIDKRLVLASGQGLPIQNSPTQNIGNLGVVIALTGPPVLGPFGAIASTGTLGKGKRKQIIFHNLATNAALNIIVLDLQGRIMDWIVPGQDWTLETSDYVEFYNPSDADNVAYSIGETYYTF